MRGETERRGVLEVAVSVFWRGVELDAARCERRTIAGGLGIKYSDRNGRGSDEVRH